MKIDITSMFFNSSVNGTATAAWRTSIGQNKTKECRIEADVPGVTDIIIGMMHLLKDDFSTKSHMTRGGNNDELLISSVFDKVYINGMRIEDCKYILSIVREHTTSHEGRKELCYSPNLCYGEDIANSISIKKMASALGCTENGCWFVYDISVKNQDELHFSAIVVDPEFPADYDCVGSERSNIWNTMVAERTGVEMPSSIFDSDTPLQQIFYGAPGTGKSHGIKKQEGNFAEVIRTTFHPDSDYSTFVGAYKPTMKRTKKCVIIDKEEREITPAVTHDEYEERITYTFVKQAFLKAYIAAWKGLKQGKDILLVIEEINRGNCAQIFGDLFQLLDREESGYSSYPISADEDLHQVLEREFLEVDDMPATIKNGEELLLPPNLYIWATMNTSDQSLFPIDSAFKRRWDWKYVPISKKDTNYQIEVRKEIDVDGENVKKTFRYDWWDFLDRVNTAIAKATSSEDKKLGYFFCKASKKIADTDKEPSIITADKFVGKVVFYLWNDVFKDFEIGDAKFRYGEDDLSLLSTKVGEDEVKREFSSFFDEEGNAKHEAVAKLLDDLKVEGKEVENGGSETKSEAAAGGFQG